MREVAGAEWEGVEKRRWRRYWRSLEKEEGEVWEV